MDLARKRTNRLLFLIIFHTISVYFILPHLIAYLFGFDANDMIISLFCQIFGFIIPLLVLLLMKTTGEDAHIILLFNVKPLYKKDSVKTVLLSVLLGVTVFVAVQYLYLGIENLYVCIANDKSIVLKLPELNAISIVLMFVVSAIIPAVSEEIVYHGMFYETFRQNKPYLQFLIPTLIFGFLHTGVFSACSAIILSVLLIAIMRKKENLLLLHIIHLTYNVMSLIFSNIVSPPLSALNNLTNHYKTGQFCGAILINFCIAAVFAVCTVFLTKYILKKDENEDAELAFQPLAHDQKSKVIVMIVIPAFFFIMSTLTAIM